MKCSNDTAALIQRHLHSTLFFTLIINKLHPPRKDVDLTIHKLCTAITTSSTKCSHVSALRGINSCATHHCVCHELQSSLCSSCDTYVIPSNTILLTDCRDCLSKVGDWACTVLLFHSLMWDAQLTLPMPKVQLVILDVFGVEGKHNTNYFTDINCKIMFS